MSSCALHRPTTFFTVAILTRAYSPTHCLNTSQAALFLQGFIG